MRLITLGLISKKNSYAILTENNWFLLEDKAKCETVIFYFSKQDRSEPFITLINIHQTYTIT